MPFATDGAVGVASCALMARNAHGSKGLRQRCAVQGQTSVQTPHWRVIQSKSGWKAAPILEFVIEH